MLDSAPPLPQHGPFRRALPPILEGTIGLLLAWTAVWYWGRPTSALDAPALVVVLMAARYGYGAGLATGLAASAASLASGGEPSTGLLAMSTHGALAKSLVYPLAGVLVGLVGDVPRAALARAREEVSSLRFNNEELAARHDVMLQAKEAMDRRVVGQLQTMASLYEAARELETMDPRQLPPALARMVQRTVEADAAAVYLGDGPDAQLVASLGTHERRLDAISLADVLDAEATGQPGPDAPWAFAVPLRHPDGRLRGAIVVERLPFHQLTAGTRQVLGLMADWASRSLARSEAYAASREAQRDHPATGIRRLAYMEERLATERSLARRYGLTLSIIAIRTPGLIAALAESEERWDQEASAVAEQLKLRTRAIDVVGHYRTADTFLLVLPVTPLDGASILAGRIAEGIAGTRAVAAAFTSPDQEIEAVIGEAFAAIADPEVRLAG